MLVNGKRKWPDGLRYRYSELVNSVVNTDGGSSRIAQTAHESARPPITSYKKLAGARGSRTHRPDRRAGANGFEVREAHQDPSAPAFYEAGPASGRSGRIIVMPATFLADRRSAIPADFAPLDCTPGATPTESGNGVFRSN